MAESALPVFEQAEFAGRLGEQLRHAGVPVTPERSVRFLDTLRLLPPVDRTTLYWAARLAFVSSCEQIEPFDRVFGLVFGDAPRPTATRGDRTAQPPGAEADPGRAPDPFAPPPAPTASPLQGGAPSVADGRGRQGDAAGRTAALRTISSPAEALAHKDFGALEPEELAALNRLFTTLVMKAPLRRTRRREASPVGRRVDLRRSLRRSQRTGGEPLRLARCRNRLRRRQLVLLCDTSGSMEPYTRAYLRLFPQAAAGMSAEAFVFATRLTRLTPVLRRARPDTALRRAGIAASDWSGGTRIGQALAEFNNRFGRRGMARGAVVVIFSDGWESEDPETISREMARLGRLAHRIIWVNPRKAAPGYAPLARGMAAALPHCDAFVSGHSFTALTEVIEAITDSTRQRS